MIVSFSLLSACSNKIEKVNSGEIYHIPFTHNYCIGTDSALVIIDRQSGKTLNIIKR